MDKAVDDDVEIINVETPLKNEDKYYSCSTCGKSFKTEQFLESHRNLSCGKFKKNQCQNCFKNFLTNQQLAKHMLLCIKK